MNLEMVLAAISTLLVLGVFLFYSGIFLYRQINNICIFLWKNRYYFSRRERAWRRNNQLLEKIKKSDHDSLKIVFGYFQVSFLVFLLIRLIPYIYLDIAILTKTTISLNAKMEQAYGVLFYLPLLVFIFSAEKIAKILRSYKRIIIAPSLWAVGCLVPLLNILAILLLWIKTKRLLRSECLEG